MQVQFSEAQRRDPTMQRSEDIIRKCVHCGFCIATCPSYLLTGDELDSPRGRIWLIRDMLENDRTPDEKVVGHIDRCLSCLACMTTCPSGVHYQHLVDHAREHIEQRFTRPWPDRAMRSVLALVLPRAWLFRISVRAAALVRPVLKPFHIGLFGGRIKQMLSLAPARLPPAEPIGRPGIYVAEGEARARVAIMPGCAQSVLTPATNAAAIRLLNRSGVEVVVPPATGCCGALPHHLGKTDAAHAMAKANLRALRKVDAENGPLDAIIATASGCGTQWKDYGHLLAQDYEFRDEAARAAGITRDITEFLAEYGLPPVTRATGWPVTYHSACSMQHGQKVTRQPPALLEEAGYDVRAVPEGHICCGSAGTYNILQPEMATALRDRKLENIAASGGEIIATGNVGCISWLATAADLPILHTVELLDYATGGPLPSALAADRDNASAAA